MAVDVLRRLKYDNNAISKVEKLVRFHDDMPTLDFGQVRRFVAAVGTDNMDNLMRLKYADLYAHTKYKWDEKLKRTDTLYEMYRKIQDDGDCLALTEMI